MSTFPDKIGLPYQPHSKTSKRTAKQMVGNVGSARDRIYHRLVDLGDRGATDEELQLALGINPNTQRPRRVELLMRGLIEDSGTTRLTRSGSKAVVWRVCQ